MKYCLAPLIWLLASALAANAAPFVEITDVQTRAVGGTQTSQDGPTTGTNGFVTQSAASTTGPNTVSSSKADYIVDDLGAFISTQVTTNGGSEPAEAEVVVTFTNSVAVLVDGDTLINQGTSAAFVDDVPFGQSAGPLAIGTHTIRLIANNATTNANLGIQFTISEDPDGGEPPPPPPPPPPPASLKWKRSEDGQWQQASKWTPERAPRAADQVAFDVLPAASLRTVPLPFIAVTSTSEDAGSVANLDISVSAVRFLNFSLSVTGAADQPESLTIRNAGVLRVDLPLPSTAASHINLNTAQAAIGDGKKQVLRRGSVLDQCRLEIGANVVWKNTGVLSIGERMDSEVLIETFLPDGTASESEGDVLLGILPGSGGGLTVTGRFNTGTLMAASRPSTVGRVVVEDGGLLRSASTEFASGRHTTAIAFIDDQPSEPGDLPVYTSENQRSTWEIDGNLVLGGVPGSSVSGANGGVALIEVMNGALMTAVRADVGAGRPGLKQARSRSARLSATGFDLIDQEPGEIRIANTLTIGESALGRADAEAGGVISAGAIRVRALGRVTSSSFARAADESVATQSLITTLRESEEGGTTVGDLTVDGGGIVELIGGGNMTVGVLSLGGVTPKKRLARLRHDSLNPDFPRGTLSVTQFTVGAGLNFPARFDLLDGIVGITQDSEIAQGSVLAGFGLINVGAAGAPDISLKNNGRIIVPPGAGRVLDLRGSFRQSETGELILTVNKENDAAVAPLKVGGTVLAIAGKVTLRFSGGRKPHPGEVFALIRAENAPVVNLATIKVAGSRVPFDIVEDDFGIVLVFK